MVSKTSLSGLNWLPQNSQSLTYFSNTCISLSEEKKMSTHNILDLNYTTSISENLVLGQLVYMVTDPVGSHVFMCVCDGRQMDDYLVLSWCVNLYVSRGVDSSERIQ